MFRVFIEPPISEKLEFLVSVEPSISDPLISEAKREAVKENKCMSVAALPFENFFSPDSVRQSLGIQVCHSPTGGNL